MIKESLNPDPLLQLMIWHDEAHQNGEPDPDAMALATANKMGKPSVRIVLFKGLSQGGILFYTNYQSRKAQELQENPQAALSFYRPKAYRQVRIEGTVQKVTPELSQAYFASRPRDRQIAAWASQQSQEIPNRDYLDSRYAAYEKEFEGKPVDCPEHWGGYRLTPELIEFWDGMGRRMHERFCYRKIDGRWQILQLAP